MTEQGILAIGLEENDAGADTIGDYLYRLLEGIWHDIEFSGKRPWGNSGWKWDIYKALASEGLIAGEWEKDGDDDWFVDCDTRAGDKIIMGCIEWMRTGRK